MSRRLLIALGGVVLAIGVLAWGGTGLARVWQMQREIEALERDLGTLRARTEKLTATVERLRNDPLYIEKLAREELGYVREGETILKFPSERR